MGYHKDFATALITTAPSPATSGLTLVVQAGKGTRFPTTFPFWATMHPKNEVPTLDNAEAVKVTGISTDTLTIVRAQKGTTAKTVVGGDEWRISNTIFAADLMNNSIVRNETPSGSINGSNTAFTVASAQYATGSLSVFLNGQRLVAGGSDDYVETATGFTMNYAPATGDKLRVDYSVGLTDDYSVGTNSTTTSEVPTGSVNSSNTAFTTARAYIAGSLKVFINGLAQIRGTDYTETTPGSGIFTMIVAPTTGDAIFVDYQYNLNPASNADTVDGVHASTTGGQAGLLIPDYAGWELAAGTFTYGSASTMNAPSDLTGYLEPGDKVRWKQGGSYKYGYVVSLTSTVITLTGGSDYTVANSAITDVYFSKAVSPDGFPDYFNAAGALTGWSGTPTSNQRFKLNGKQCIFWFAITGTSNSTSTTIGIPVTAKNNGGFSWEGTLGLAGDNGGTFTSACRQVIDPGSNANLLTCYSNMVANGWTASGTKAVRGTAIYEIA